MKFWPFNDQGRKPKRRTTKKGKAPSNYRANGRIPQKTKARTNKDGFFSLFTKRKGPLLSRDANKRRSRKNMVRSTNSTPQSKIFKPKIPLTTSKTATHEAKRFVLSNPFSFNEGGFISGIIGKLNTYRLLFINWRLRLQWVVTLTLFVAFLFVSYLSFFDTYFLIRRYNVQFAPNSYLSQEATTDLLLALQTDKLFGLLPYNQYWFLNEKNLTLAAQAKVPEISTIEITNREWPNKTDLKIYTQPILVTLDINSGEYWRVSTEGRITGKDDLGIRERVVVLESDVNSFGKDDLTGYKVLKNDEKESQYNRLWYINWLWKELEQRGLEVSRTSIRSLNDLEVTITLANNTTLLFHTSEVTQANQLKRLDTLTNTDIGEKIKAGAYDYVDMRFPRRIFVCQKGQSCVEGGK
jgi:hypothetical protein